MTRLLVFDIFDTLLKIHVPTNPYGRLIERFGLPEEAHVAVQTRSLGLVGLLAAVHQRPVMAADVADLELALTDELRSIRMFPDTGDALEHLRARGDCRIVLASNLAMPYAVALSALPPDTIDHAFLSFELGCRKPEDRFWNALSAYYGCRPEDMLLIDDRQDNVEGFRAFGGKAVRIDRSAGEDTRDVIHTLAALTGGLWDELWA